MTPATLRLHAVALAGGFVPPEDTVALLRAAADVLDTAQALARAVQAALAATDEYGSSTLGQGVRRLALRRVTEVLAEEAGEEEDDGL